MEDVSTIRGCAQCEYGLLMSVDLSRRDDACPSGEAVLANSCLKTVDVGEKDHKK